MDLPKMLNLQSCSMLVWSQNIVYHIRGQPLLNFWGGRRWVILKIRAEKNFVRHKWNKTNKKLLHYCKGRKYINKYLAEHWEGKKYLVHQVGKNISCWSQFTPTSKVKWSAHNEFVLGLLFYFYRIYLTVCIKKF